MATQQIPQIPPRPTRSQAQKSASTNGGSTLGSDIPKIPPRPTNRRIDRSISPLRESYARSPLNEPGFVASNKHAALKSENVDTLDLNTPARSPSVSHMPSVGQEGIEYAEICTPNPSDSPGAPNETRNIAEDLKLYAPRPSLPGSSAKGQIDTVTRTDSSQAAAFGLGKPRSEDRVSVDDRDPESRPLKAKSSFASSMSNGAERPHSSADNEDQPDGPDVGQRVPMYPNAGMVQAPSPSPYSQFQPGIGFHNDGSKPLHQRRKSGRGFEGPPGSYGMHGHGIMSKDKFEQAYYEKHPELWKKELSAYGEERNDWAMSSEDLNKIVRQTGHRGSGLDYSPALVGTPTEQVGYVASDEYISRMASPRPSSISSPDLRKESSASGDKDDTSDNIPHAAQKSSEENITGEYDDSNVVHVEEPSRRISTIYGREKHAESTENLGPSGGNTPAAGGFIVESGYGVPILASDEVAKEPFGYELQPAVSPLQDINYHDDQSHYFRTGSASTPTSSRPQSRHGSSREMLSIAQQGEFDREARSTPLEDVEEYEPLFPEVEKGNQAQHKPPAQTERLKGRHFPSQDIWEDAPDSLMQTATVSTPQLPEEPDEGKTEKPLDIQKGETPEQAFARRQEELADIEFKTRDTESFLGKSKQPWQQNESIAADIRPELKQRFPSRDIWEDSPDSLLLQTTVSRPQSEDVATQEEQPATEVITPNEQKQVSEKPTTRDEEHAITGTTATPKPSIPPRPAKKISDPKPNLKAEDISIDKTKPAITSPVLKAKPAIPERSKPAIPSRPIKKNSGDSADGAPLSNVTSAGSAKPDNSNSLQPNVAAVLKPKPPVPSRPIGSKIAALQGGFLSDLNKRLQLGPQAPKKEETKKSEEIMEEKEKAPLVDARKGRARGPARRAPARVEAKATGALPTPGKKLVVSVTSTVWEIDPKDGALMFASEHGGVKKSDGDKKIESGGKEGEADEKEMEAGDNKIRAGEKKVEVEEENAEVEERKAEVEERKAEVEEKKVEVNEVNLEDERKNVEIEENIDAPNLAKEDAEEEEAAPTTTTIVAPLLTSDEVVTETSASSSLEAHNAAKTSDGLKVDVGIGESSDVGVSYNRELKDKAKDARGNEVVSSLAAEPIEGESFGKPKEIVEEVEPEKSEKTVESKEE